ncbi:MAG: flagellar hook-length control protein FliK [Gammaproteobacteria bacterium]|nr:flagellar hook-length control protein FliK [Gammaproteobacteria bacterium]
MQGLVTNIASGSNVTNAASQASTGLNGNVNGASAGAQAFSPLFVNMMTSGAYSEQVQFKSQVLDAFDTQALPLERQLLPLTGANGELKKTMQENQAEIALLDEGTVLPVNVGLQPAVSSLIVTDVANRAHDLAGQLATSSSAAAAQIAGQGLYKLQQDLILRQSLASAPIEPLEGELPGSRLLPQLESAAMMGNSAQLSNMLLKQSAAASSSENRISDSFSSALGNLTTLSAEAKGSAEAKTPMQGSINTPFSQQANWAGEVGSRVKWMVSSQVQSAELKMNPASLGPIEVKISVQNDQTTIHFTAQNGAVRDALDTAMPKLREMLADSGVNLSDVDVSDQSFAQQQRASEQEQRGPGDEHTANKRDDGSGIDDVTDSEQDEMMLSSRIVDYYA